MTQVINKIHSNNTIIANTDENLYKYTNGMWVKQMKTQSTPKTDFYKVFDINPLTDLNPNDYNAGDYIALYTSKYNYIKYSEALNNDVWIKSKYNNKDTIYKITSSEKYYFPNTANESINFRTKNDIDANTDHYIKQEFDTVSSKLYIASCLVKMESETSSSYNIALSIFNNTYGFGLSAKYDLLNNEGYDSSGFKTVNTIFLDNNYNIISDEEVLTHVHHYSAGIQKITDSTLGGTYFRIYIICNFDFQSLCDIRLNILDVNANYLFSSNGNKSKYGFYISGFQLEKYDSMNITYPSEYIYNKSNTTIRLKVLQNMYKIVLQGATKIIQLSSSQLYYINNVKETTSDGVTYLTYFEPTISNPYEGDIAVVPSLLSFSTYLKTLDTDDDSVVGFGTTYNSNNPEFTINYDSSKNAYIMRYGSKYVILSSKTDNKKLKAITRAITFNQGYFETWSKPGPCRFRLGYNTGGGYNYLKLHNINSKLP